MKTIDKLVEVLKEFTLPEYTKSVIKGIKTSIRLRTSIDKKVTLGNTKFGGPPHLPKGKVWPLNKNNKPLSFLAQVNLEEIYSLTPEKSLPQKGILYFFLNFQNPEEGIVLFEKNTQTLEITAIPEILLKEEKNLFQKLFNKPGIHPHYLKEMGTLFEIQYSPPQEQTLYMNQIIKKINPKAIFHKTFVYDSEIYESALFYEERENEMTTNHHLLGFEDVVQFGFHQENLIPPKTKMENLSLNQMQEILKWRLLFQCDSDENLNLSWGDWGKVYFFIHEDDLRKGNFENIKINWSCY